MHTSQDICTDSCAAQTQYLHGFRVIAQITHIFSRSNNFRRTVFVKKYRISKNHLEKVSCNNADQCVQIVKFLANKGIQLHSYMCVQLCKVFTFGVIHHE